MERRRPRGRLLFLLRREGEASLRYLQTNVKYGQQARTRNSPPASKRQIKSEQSEPRALAGTARMILALSWKSYLGQTGKKGERRRHVIHR